MSRRPARLLAWFLWLATIGFCAAGLVVALAVPLPLTASTLVQGIVGILVFRLSFAVIGLVLTLRRPSNPIGWLYAAAGLVWSLEVPGTPWVEHLVRERLPLPPAAQVAAVVQEVAWAPAVALGVTLPLLLLPDGRLRSPRWRPAVVASLSGAVLVVVGVGLAPIQLASVPATNPLALAGVAGRVATVVGFTGFALHLGGLAAALVSVVLRFRSSRGVERQQLRWVATGATAAVVGLLAVSALLVAGGLWGFSSGAWVVVLLLTLPCLPVSIAVAVLRYRLYDLDYVVSRALVYGLLTAGGVAVYVAVVKSTEWLLREGIGLGGSLLATAVIAVGFAPARDRLQRWVDRRLYGERHDPVRAVARLGQRLRDAPASGRGEDVLAGVLQGVCESLRLPSASLLVEDGLEVATYGRSGATSESIPLEHEGQQVGALLVGPRTGEQTLGAADRRILEVLSAPVAVAVHAVLLSQELQHSRERLVAAREEERRRLRRDLHDGLGPILTAVTLKADAARSALEVAPDRADGLLAELRGDANQAIGDLRRVIYDLRPAALDELGLLGALSQQMDRFARQGLSITLDAPPALPVLPAAVEVAAYRIITEALTNIARHAYAHQVTITIAIAVDGELCLAVHDDGTTPMANGGGWRPGTGLQSMNERVAELGGTLEVGPTATGGRVQASLPLELA